MTNAKSPKNAQAAIKRFTKRKQNKKKNVFKRKSLSDITGDRIQMPSIVAGSKKDTQINLLIAAEK